MINTGGFVAGAADQRILIAVQADISNAVLAFDKVKQKIKQDMAEIRKAISMSQQMTTPQMRKTFGTSLTKSAYTKELRKQYAGLGEELQTLNIAHQESIAPLKHQEAVQKRAIATAKTGQRAFAGYAMSIMFFGMAVKKFFDTMWKEGGKAFNEISHSVEGTVTGFDMLEGSMKYLQFSLGQALEPFLEHLIPIVDYVSDWVSKNEKLTAGIVVTGTVLGGLFMFGGMGVLAINGFIELAQKMGAITTTADGLVKYNWGAISDAITKALGVISILWGLKVAKDSVDAWNDGSWLTGALKGVASASYMAGGFFLLKGSTPAGLVLLATGFIIDSVAERNLWTKVSSIASPFLAFFQTLGQMVGKYFARSFEEVVIESLLISLAPLLAFTPGLRGDLMAQLGVTRRGSDFNFMDGFISNMADWNIKFERLDENLNRNLNSVDELTQRRMEEGRVNAMYPEGAPDILGHQAANVINIGTLNVNSTSADELWESIRRSNTGGGYYDFTS